jgi:type I restriction enzyme R subunit
MIKYNIVMSTDESTVAAEYQPQNKRSTSYQSEAELEKAFINQLGEQGYEYLEIKNEKDFVDNIRKQVEKLNHYSFSDNEWNVFFKNNIANPTEGIVEKTRKIQEDFIQVLQRDNGELRSAKELQRKLRLFRLFREEAHKTCS